MVKGGPPATAAPSAQPSLCHPTLWQHIAERDDEDEVKQALQEVNVPMQAQQLLKSCLKNGTQNLPPPLTQGQIKAIAKDIRDGQITLPEIVLPNDSDYLALWPLVGAGSTINAINGEKHVPGAKHLVRRSPEQEGCTCKTANGGTMNNIGSLSFDAVTTEGHQRHITWENTDVDFPILSTKRMHQGGDWMLFGEDSGFIIDGPTGETDHFIAHGDAYFIRLCITKEVIQPKMDFQRPGRVA